MNKRIIFKVQFFILAACKSVNVSDILKPIMESTRHLAVFGGLVGVALPLAIGQARQSYVNKKCEKIKGKVSSYHFHKEQQEVAPSVIKNDQDFQGMQDTLLKLKSKISRSTGVVSNQYAIHPYGAETIEEFLGASSEEYDYNLKLVHNYFFDNIGEEQPFEAENVNKIKEYFERKNYKSWEENEDKNFIESLSNNFFKEALQFTYYSIKEKTHYSLELALLQASFLFKNKDKIKEEVKNRIDYSKWSACNFTMKSFALYNALILLGCVGFLDKDMRSFMLEVLVPVSLSGPLTLVGILSYYASKDIRKWRSYNINSIASVPNVSGENLPAV